MELHSKMLLRLIHFICHPLQVEFPVCLQSLILNSVLMKRTEFTYLWKDNVTVSNHHDQLSWRVNLSTKLFSQKDIHRKALKSAVNSWKVILSLFQLFLFLKDLTGNCWNELLKWLTGSVESLTVINFWCIVYDKSKFLTITFVVLRGSIPKFELK